MKYLTFTNGLPAEFSYDEEAIWDCGDGVDGKMVKTLTDTTSAKQNTKNVILLKADYQTGTVKWLNWG